MTFSIVIPTYHRNDLLQDCLSCLSPEIQKIGAFNYEVIVSDDGTRTNAKELIERQFPWCRWVQGPQKGPAYNRNHGANCAKSKWIIFLDDDCLPDANLLQAYHSAITGFPKTTVFEGCIKPDRPKERFNEESPVNLKGGYLWSCNFCVKRAVFEKIGGFDVNFPYPAMEDVDLRERIKKSGTQIKFQKDASVIHPWRKRRDLGFVKKHFISTLYFRKKNNLPNFKIKEVLFVYAHQMKYVAENAFRFRCKGIF